jgi:ferredoxin
MSKKYAVRNIRLCTKDCLCLYVCPTGATDTENSIIDVEKCIGCGDCADACPSGAISMVPVEYPPQQTKTEAVVCALNALLHSNWKQLYNQRTASERCFGRQKEHLGLDEIRHRGVEKVETHAYLCNIALLATVIAINTPEKANVAA